MDQILTNLKCGRVDCHEVLKSGPCQLGKCCGQYFHNHCADHCIGDNQCGCGDEPNFDSATINTLAHVDAVEHDELLEYVRKIEELERQNQQYAVQIEALRNSLRTVELENDGLMEDAMAYRIMRDGALEANAVVRENPPVNANGNGNGDYSDSE